jgi:HK97 family phage major capsid protein
MRFSVAKRETFGKLIAEGRAILDAAQTAKRELSAEETSRYEKIMGDVDKIREEIATEERASEREDRLKTLEAEAARALPLPGGVRPVPGGPLPAPSERRAAFGAFMESRANSADYAFQPEPVVTGAEWRAVNRLYRGFNSPEIQRMMERPEMRALQADQLAAGGSTFALEEFLARLIIFVNNQVHIRAMATVLPVTQSDSIGAPSLDTDVDDADWTSELATGSEDSAMAFGKRVMRTHPLAKRIKISNKLLQLTALDVENLVAQRLAYKYGVSQEKAFLTGSGAERPLGVFIADANGITTARDTTCASTTVFTADELIDLKGSLKPQYQASPSTCWCFHRDAMTRVRKLKDGNGAYLWTAALSNYYGQGQQLVAGSPDLLLGIPIMQSEYAPNTFTASQYIMVLGDWRFYWIAESLNVSLRRLVELYAETNQVGFIMRGELDGAPVLNEAWARLKLHA